MTAGCCLSSAKNKRPALVCSELVMITGIVFTGVGLVSAASGVIVFVAAARGNLATDANNKQVTKEAQQGAGVALMIGGGAFIGVGIPLWVVGASSPSAPAAAELVVGPTSAQLRGSF